MDGIDPWLDFPSHGEQPEIEPRLPLGRAVQIIAAISILIWAIIIFAIIKGVIE
jgi:hypothetical protein